MASLQFSRELLSLATSFRVHLNSLLPCFFVPPAVVQQQVTFGFCSMHVFYEVGLLAPCPTFILSQTGLGQSLTEFKLKRGMCLLHHNKYPNSKTNYHIKPNFSCALSSQIAYSFQNISYLSLQL